MSRIWLTMDMVLDIHARQIAQFGGSSGLRDPGQLEAALFRPQSGYYAGVIEEAAALWESLSHNHAFIDGNKRTAFAGMLVFLGLNGYRLTASPAEVLNFILPLYETQAFRFETLVDWLGDHTAPV